MQTFKLFMLLMALAASCVAFSGEGVVSTEGTDVSLQKGAQLPPFYLDSSPVAFDYKPNGENQLILIYPLRYSSRKIGQFNREVIAAGFCPKSIVNMAEKAWYAPIYLAEQNIKKEVKNSPNPDCTVTADYEGLAKSFWGLDKGSVIIVVDGKGLIKHIHYGIPKKDAKREILAALETTEAPITSAKDAESFLE